MGTCFFPMSSVSQADKSNTRTFFYEKIGSYSDKGSDLLRVYGSFNEIHGSFNEMFTLLIRMELSKNLILINWLFDRHDMMIDMMIERDKTNRNELILLHWRRYCFSK